MTQAFTLKYLFDPLCGWCYGIAPTISALAKHTAINLRPQPSGLFSGAGARPMKSFAQQAWENDLSIAALSGQEFSQIYRRDVLGAENASLDSTVATLAFTAVEECTPERSLEALTAIQMARYVKGKDVTSAPVVAAVLGDLGLADAAARIVSPDKTLLELVKDRISATRKMMAGFNLRGVPAVIAEFDTECHVLDASTLYSGPSAVLGSLKLA